MIWQPVSVSIVAYDGYPLEVALDSLARLGVQSVEMAYIEGYSRDFSEELFAQDNARKLRRIFEVAGIHCRALSAHFDLSRPGGNEALRRRIEFAASIGAQLVSTVSGPKEREAEFLGNLASAVRSAEESQVTIGLENPADDTVATIGDGKDAARVVAGFDHRLVRINYDPGNFLTHAPGVAPQDDVLPTLSWCAGIHLKDLRPTPDGYTHTALGDGTIDWAVFFDALAQATHAPLLSIEHPLRMQRDPRGRIVLDSAVMPLAEIETILKRSLHIVHQQIARLANPQIAPVLQAVQERQDIGV